MEREEEIRRQREEEAEQAARIEAERQRLAHEAEEEKERQAREEEDRIAREEAERQAREEEARFAAIRAEEERIAREEAERQAREEEARRAAQAEARRQQEEQERLRREEEERLANEPPSWKNDPNLFRSELQRLARGRDWKGMAELTSNALQEAGWAARPESRVHLLLDLARLYRDRLSDAKAAEDTFRELLSLEAANHEAIEHLAAAFSARGEFRALHDLYAAAVEPEWDPKLRLEWTQTAAKIANERLQDSTLATSDWERLWRLGDATEEALGELNRAYREGLRWDRLAEFLAERTQRLQASSRALALRELGEVYLSALRDHERAAPILEELLAAHPDDAVARLAWARLLVRRGDFAALEALAEAPRSAHDGHALDLARLAADALWQAGEQARAIAVYDRILAALPTDEDALRAKENFLTQNNQHEPLCLFLEQRAERVSDPKEKIALLERAADVAERDLNDLPKAAGLLERSVALDPSREKTFAALVEIYESLGDLNGVAHALEGQLSTTREPEARIVLLRRLGDHYAQRLGDDIKAEGFWREILTHVQRDDQVEDELFALLRRRGQFEALDAALQRQIWRTPDPSRALSKAREAAQNCEDALSDPARTLEAWQRFLDLAPNDGEALQAVARHYKSNGNPRDLIAAQEAELRNTADQEARRRGALVVARQWESLGANKAALSAYERALHLNPTDSEGLEAIIRQRGAAEPGAAICALETAAAAVSDAGEQARFLRLAQQTLPQDATVSRFDLGRRVLWLSGAEPPTPLLDEVSGLSGAASLHTEMIDTYARLSSRAGQDARLRYHREIAKLAEGALQAPARAFLALWSVGLDPVALQETAESLLGYAEASGRYEDMLAVLDVLSRPELPVEKRREAITARAKLCEEKLNDPARAFWEWRRRLDLDSADGEAKRRLESLAAQHNLWRPLDAIYGELWDGAHSVTERIDIARTRQRIRRDHLNDRSGALDALIAIYRLAPEAMGVHDELLESAEELNAWGLVLPLLEGSERAEANPNPAELARLAALYETKLGDPEHALELHAEALSAEPDADAHQQNAERLAAVCGSYERLAESLRRAAALTQDQDRALSLYRRVASLYENELSAPRRAVELHRRILQKNPADLVSLEVVIKVARERHDWQELREHLRQWIDVAPASASRVAQWMEIGQLSRDHLNDIEGALRAFAAVLDSEPEHSEAELQLRAIAQASAEPSLDLKLLRVELPRARGERRHEVLRRMAEVQERLFDFDGAIESLRALTQEDIQDRGVVELERLYQKRARFVDLADLLEARAQQAPEASAKIELLHRAISVREERAPAPDALERLYRRLLEATPADEVARDKLAALLRNQGRAEDLAELLAQSAPQADPQTRADLILERGRLQRVLGRSAEALVSFRSVLDQNNQHPGALLSLIVLAPEAESYDELRRIQARGLSGPAASLVFCHLAELADQRGEAPAKISALYREARQLDPENDLATEALKNLGRRAKNWRQSAALLPDADEATLTPKVSAERLRQRGAQEQSPKTAASWFWRAVAVDPSNVAAWDALSALLGSQGQPALAYRAALCGLAAYEAIIAPAPDKVRAYAERIYRVSLSAQAAGEDAAARRLALRAYRIDPAFGPAAISVADEAFSNGAIEEAFRLYDHALTHAEVSDGKVRVHAIYRRGVLARRLGRKDRALQDLRETVRAHPLHAEALASLAEILTEEGRTAAAVQHHIQALLVESDTTARGRRYLAIGKLLEDKLSLHHEAGTCYDLALSAGLQDLELVRRALGHYQRVGDKPRALATLERLLERTSEPSELANLWTTRGELEDDQARATEAFDMALSYEPGHKAALEGLARLLEARGEWAQLLDIYEARLDGGAPSERANALRQMARISAQALHDNERAEGYLLQLGEAETTREDLEQLLSFYPESRKSERRDLTGRLVAFGPHWFAQAIEFSKLLLQDNERRWAWFVLSPMSQMAFPEPSLKATMQELRKEFEKRDNLAALTPQLHHQVRAAGENPVISEVLSALDAALAPLVCKSPEEAGAVGAAKLDERTAPGKLFRQLCQSLGLEDAVAWRVQEMEEPIAVLAANPVQILIRADLVQSLSSGDLAFAMAQALDLAAPGRRLVAACRKDQREDFFPALFAALGLSEHHSPLTAQMKEALAEAPRASLASKLKALEGDAASLGQGYAQGILDTARRVGAVVAGDLRLASRAVSRLYEAEATKPAGFSKPAELEEHLETAPVLRGLLAFACTPRFGSFLV
jgi:tetratricopeptide (TPR) repeat protein